MHSRLFICFVLWRALCLYASAGNSGSSIHGGTMEFPLLYDVRKPSADNPVVARVEEWNFDLPLSELRAFEAGRPARPATCRPGANTEANINALIEEQILVREAYEEGIDGSMKIRDMMAYTRDTFLEETFLRTALGADAPNKPDFKLRVQQLVEDIYGKHPLALDEQALSAAREAGRQISVSSWKACSSGDCSLEGAGYSADCEAIFAGTQDRSLARVENESFSLARFLQIYAGMPILERPNLRDKNAILQIAKQQLSERMLVHEAVARGIDKLDTFRAALLVNQNTLVRLEVLNRFTVRANEMASGPDQRERAIAWFSQHQAELGGKEENGRLVALSWPVDEAEIRQLYMEHLRDELMARDAAPRKKNLWIKVYDAAVSPLPKSGGARPAQRIQMAVTEGSR